jgi:hypothetical protein
MGLDGAYRSMSNLMAAIDQRARQGENTSCWAVLKAHAISNLDRRNIPANTEGKTAVEHLMDLLSSASTRAPQSPSDVIIGESFCSP